MVDTYDPDLEPLELEWVFPDGTSRAAGVIGPPGRGITVSATPPADPELNDLWVDIS